MFHSVAGFFRYAISQLVTNLLLSLIALMKAIVGSIAKNLADLSLDVIPSNHRLESAHAEGIHFYGMPTTRQLNGAKRNFDNFPDPAFWGVEIGWVNPSAFMEGNRREHVGLIR